MALHLNLYHEVVKAKALKRRDPLKLSMYGIAAIIALCAGYYFFQLLKMHGIHEELAKVKAQFEQLEPRAKIAAKREDEITAQIKTSELLVKRIEERFYWAPLLEQVLHVVPREVQITRVGGDLTGEGVRRCSLTIDGLSAGTDPRRIAEDLRTAIADQFAPKYRNVTSSFKTLEDGNELVMLDGKQLPTATFAINVQLSTGEEKPAPVTVRRKK